MSSFLNQSVITYGTNKLRKGMHTNLKIEHLKEPEVFDFDKNRNYFLYIHVPFCNEFCTFCSFHKFKYKNSTCKEYFGLLRRELKIAKDKGFSFDTLYVGGGTPLIDSDELLKTLEFAKELFDIKEISCESSPNHIAPKVIEKFRGVVDRLSIGIQTFDDEILKKIGRFDRYGASEVLQQRVSEIVGILPIVSLDLIFNMPNQNRDTLLRDLRIAKSLNVEQITTYPLMQSNLLNQSVFESYKTISQSKEFEFYKLIKRELKNYSMSNAWSFSKNKTSLSDEYTVNRSEYIGIGSGAFSYINNQLFVNAYDLKRHKNLVESGVNSIVAKTSKFTLKRSTEYHFLLALFGGRIDIGKFNETFKVSLMDNLSFEIFALKLCGAIEIKNETIFPTHFGEFLSLVLMKEFYMGMDRVRQTLRDDYL